MDMEDRTKCSELWQMASGDYIAPEYWTEEAADELAKFFAENYNCSSAMSYVPRPCGPAPGWTWVVSYVYRTLKNRNRLAHRQVFASCNVHALRTYKSTIPAQCLK